METQPWALVLCLYPPGTPEVWVQVQMEATESLSFTVRCGFLGSGSISLVTVSYGGPDGAGGTKLAVLHPTLGTQHWAPACQAHWETRSSISLTLEASEGRSSRHNTTFCCRFTSFPEGSQEACGNISLSTDQGGAGEEGGQGGTWGTSHLTRLSLCAQGSLLLLQPLCCGLTWQGSWGSPGSFSSAPSTSSTSCVDKGTGETRPLRDPVQSPTALGRPWLCL